MKVAIYCRLSEEDRDKVNKDDDSQSIQNQKTLLIDYAVKQHWEIFNIYSDDNFTGASRNRPAFNELLKEAENRSFDIVLCKSQSRFTRELELVEKYIHSDFPRWGIRFVSLVDNADTENKGNKKSRQINGLVNEWYLEDMSDNIKSVLLKRREKGYHIGSFALYGYQKDPNQKGHLIIDEEAAEVVREVFNLFANGMGKLSIARLLNSKGIPNPTEYKRLKGLRFKNAKSKNATLWKYVSISSMLTNEIYIGNMVQGKYESISYKTKQNKPRDKKDWIKVEGTHEPIISMDVWKKVQELIKQKSKPCYHGEVGIFAKKVKCMYCGYYLHTTITGGKKYLKCPTREISKENCDGCMISLDVLERIVLQQLQEIHKSYIDEDILERKIEFDQSISKTIREKESQLSGYQQKQNEFTSGLSGLYLDKVNGLLSEVEFQEIKNHLASQKETLKLHIETLKTELELLYSRQKKSDTRREIVVEYTNVVKLNRMITSTLIDYINIGKRYPNSKERPVEIHWNF